MNGRILVVEDDREISRVLTSFLNENGYETDAAYDGREASVKMRSLGYDLILMDLMLPGKDGETLIRELHQYDDTPVIVLSAKSMMETKLLMLKIGADDYIVKPFDLNEVLVRIQVVLRRNASFKMSEEKGSKILKSGELYLYPDENRVTYLAKEITFTSKELQLLKLFLEHPQKTFTKANLYEAVWEDVYYYEDNTINVHISNLRNKLKKATGKDFIETVWGIGYRLKGE